MLLPQVKPKVVRWRLPGRVLSCSHEYRLALIGSGRELIDGDSPRPRTMIEPRLLSRAPIREALIDIQVPVKDDPDLAVLEELARALDGYPTVQRGFQVTSPVKIDFDPGSPETPRFPTPRQSGFRAISEDERQVVQFRTNGFSFSRLSPYESWDRLAEDARAMWALYRERLDPSYATRLAVRYVNHVRLSHPVDPTEYFLGIPSFPDEWPQNVSSFVYRQTLHDQETGFSVNVMHALVDDVDEDKIGVIFDIDAYAGGPIPTSDEELWGTFSGLRALKNRIFFSGITEKTLALVV